MYHDGQSEVIVGKALADGYRDKVLLADKMPVWMADSEEEMRQIFENQLERLDVEYFDFYLAHNLNKAFWEKAVEYKLLDFLKEKREAGKIKYIGFSFHDDLEFFKKIIDVFEWDFCQIQLNFMDKNFQAGVEGLKYAGEKNIPVVIMEPLKGGKLTDKLPISVAEIWKEALIERTPAEWALRWVANFPEVLTVLSGMSEPEHVVENIGVLSDAGVGLLTELEMEIIDRASTEYNRLIKASCTRCKYCLPCPMGIDIPDTLGHYNDWFLYDQNPKIKKDFFFNNGDHLPSTCIDCKECEKKCPQQLPISSLMKEMVEIFEK